jgi:hypothetical protein
LLAGLVRAVAVVVVGVLAEDRSKVPFVVDQWLRLLAGIGAAGLDSGHGDLSVANDQAHVARVAGDDGDRAGRR